MLAADSWHPVAIEVDAEDWLARVAAGPDPTARLFTQCEAWLRPVDPAERSAEAIGVFIRQRLVGHLHGPAAGPFHPVLTAAACYQERPVVRAQLLWSTDPTARSLAVAAPSTVPQPPAF